MKKKSLLTQLQQADDGTKTQWLWGLTILCGVVVIVFWVIYINGTIARVDSIGLAAAPSYSVRQTLWAGITSVKEQVANLIAIAARERLVKIVVPHQDFVADITPVKPTQLP